MYEFFLDKVTDLTLFDVNGVATLWNGTYTLSFTNCVDQKLETQVTVGGEMTKIGKSTRQVSAFR